VPFTRIWLPCTETVVCERVGSDADPVPLAEPVEPAGAQAATRAIRTSALESSARVAWDERHLRVGVTRGP
jgi:hypothetical protein